MDTVDDIHRRMQVLKLRAWRGLIEIEQDALMDEITSPLTSQDRREEAFMRRGELASRRAEIVEALKIHEGN